MTLAVVHRYDGPHRYEGMLVERAASDGDCTPSEPELVDLFGSTHEAALWSVEYLARITPRRGAAPRDLFLLRRAA